MLTTIKHLRLLACFCCRPLSSGANPFVECLDSHLCHHVMLAGLITVELYFMKVSVLSVGYTHIM